ncbi:CDP-diacylglycerol--serine O-phosphatidyltransferase [Candidatus Amoebophilus asiaticus]|nr:CDP-diacylglycerol--serine O-phosphatidyltransferase [Candidatus Amoebophilus asiaticus]
MGIKKHIPNFFTVLNLICGCIAITESISYELIYASYWILIAALCDFLDGFFAKLLNAHSNLGKQLDSLADMVSFGIAPTLLMFQLIRYPQGSNYSVAEYTTVLAIGHYMAYVAFIIAICSAIRLAVFNLDTKNSTYFSGLPTPASALFIASLPLFTDKDILGITNYILNPYLLALFSIVLSILLLSRVRLFSLKFNSFKWQDNQIRYIFLLLSLLLLLIFSLPGLSIVFVLYIILSVVDRQLNKSEPEPEGQ